MPSKEQIQKWLASIDRLDAEITALVADKSSTVNYTMAVQRARSRESVKQRLEDAGITVPDFPIKGHTK